MQLLLYVNDMPFIKYLKYNLRNKLKTIQKSSFASINFYAHDNPVKLYKMISMEEMSGLEFCKI